VQVDAALDATNLRRIATYMRRCTRPGAPQPVQGIVISLKDAFYQQADALVGVTKAAAGAASAVYTMDLERFGAPQE
jgi:structural maintenance of chromosome 1